MKFRNLFLLFLVLLGLFQVTYAKEIITVVEITNQSLSDPMDITEEPYVNDKQDLYGVQVDTTQFTRIDDLTLGDRVEFDIEYFDFQTKKYSKDGHNIVMASVKPSDALIYVYSEPLQLVVLKGVIKDIDIDGDSVFDIRVRYDGLDSETGYGILNLMRFNDEDYKIYGSNFCERTDAVSEFQCVQVTDKNLGTYQLLQTETSAENRAALNQTAEEELVDELSKDDGEVTDKPVEQPKAEEDDSLSGKQIMMIIGIIIGAIILIFIVIKIMKVVLKKKGSSDEYNDEEWD